MAQNTPISMNIIQSLDELKVLLFWKIIQDDNVLLLDSNCTDRQYTESERHELQEAWYKVYDDYYTQANDSRSKHELRKQAEELTLSYRIYRLHKAVELMCWLHNHKVDLPEEIYTQHYTSNIQLFVDIEPKLKSKLNIFDETLETIEKVSRYMGSLNNQLSKMTAGKVKRVERSISNIYTKVAYVAHEIGVQLNVREMSCSEWLAYQSLAGEKRRAQQNNKSKKR